MKEPIGIEAHRWNCPDDRCDRHRALSDQLQRPVVMLLVSMAIGMWFPWLGTDIAMRVIKGFPDPVFGGKEIVEKNEALAYVPVHTISQSALAKALETKSQQILGQTPTDDVDPQVVSYPIGWTANQTWKLVVRVSGNAEIHGDKEAAKTEFWMNEVNGWSGDHCADGKDIKGSDHLHQSHIVLAQSAREAQTWVAYGGDGSNPSVIVSYHVPLIWQTDSAGRFVAGNPDLDRIDWAVAVTAKRTVRVWGTIPDSARQTWNFIANSLKWCK